MGYNANRAMYPKEYYAWNGLKGRCSNPKDKAYPNYGGRGIDYDPKWSLFLNFIADMGRAPGPEYSIERRDNNKGYWPDNCYWATRSEQNKNRRVNKNHSTGHKGIHLIQATGKYSVFDGPKYVASCDSLEQALEVRKCLSK